MKNKLFLIIMAGLMMGCSAQKSTPTSVGSVELEKYAGLWYDIASFPMRFQKGCHCTTAEYTLMPKGYVKVDNRCRKNSYDGKKSGIKGKAFVVEGSNNTKLKVQFFWPFKGDYWIVRLEKDYKWAVVSAPAKDYLWILSRTPQMEEATFDEIIRDLRSDGYDVDRLVKVPQECQ